ncbi:alginate lyase family protein [Paenibacillus faecalis]|uniref:alginate lyase family protein n=1 Tax=Paenibacillus faecalis TaxID=2079532 RepID=UPI000D0F07DD|nr:alginate lyase family protein [Paenibacillus faecalis]
MSSMMEKIRKLSDLPRDKAAKLVMFKAFAYFKNRLRKYRLLAAPIHLNSVHFIDFQSKNCFLYEEKDRELYSQLLHDLKRDQSIVQDADRICLHKFNLLGSGDVQLGDKLPWNTDFKVNYTWKNDFYKLIPIVDLSNHADVKVPWELSRFQHVFTLGKAYWLTNDEKYAREFHSQVEDWIRQNPVEMSVNWTCTMDVAIRAVNWIAGAYFFKKSSGIEPSFWGRFHASLYLHGSFIMNNLENRGEHTGNHYLCNLAGLVALGLYFDGFSIGQITSRHGMPQEWLNYGLQELEREMFVQVNPDGSNYEASTSYHRLVTECFLVMTVLCSRNEIVFPENYMERLEKMCQFLFDTMKPNGLTPVVGDADDGRLLIPADYGTWVRNDFRHLLVIAGELFNREDFRYAGREYAEDALWITGPRVMSAAPSALIHQPQRWSAAAAYPDGGYYVLRQGMAYCLIRCGELSFHGHGAHSHNDQLSFELNIEGQDFIVDPGSYVYTADYRMRNLFRSTAMHNTIEIDGKEQNDFEEKVLFLMREQTFAHCDRFGRGYFAGSHQGYVKKCGVLHKREITLTEHSVEIMDKLESLPGHSFADVPPYYATFVFAPGVEVEKHGDKVLLRQQEISAEMTFVNAEHIKIDTCSVSRRYGEKEMSLLLRVKGADRTLRTFMYWSTSEKRGNVDELYQRDRQTDPVLFSLPIY